MSLPVVEIQMSALGHKRPVRPILPERLLSKVNRTFQIGQFFETVGAISRMSAFLNSGRSEDGIWSISRGRFRPEADDHEIG